MYAAQLIPQIDTKIAEKANLWMKLIRLLFFLACQYLHSVSLSINHIEAEVLAILQEYDQKPLKASKPFQD